MLFSPRALFVIYLRSDFYTGRLESLWFIFGIGENPDSAVADKFSVATIRRSLLWDGSEIRSLFPVSNPTKYVSVPVN